MSEIKIHVIQFNVNIYMHGLKLERHDPSTITTYLLSMYDLSTKHE